MSYNTDVQIWDNAAFDNGDSENVTSNRTSWGSLKSTFENPKASFDSVSGKENQGSFLEKQISSVSSSLVSSTNMPFKPINTDGALEKSRNKGALKKAAEEIKVLKRKDGKESPGDKKIDEEIKEIEIEISRLNSRLEALRLKNMEMSLQASEKRGRVVPAKFMDQKQSVIAKNAEEKKMIEQISSTNGKTRIQRRGFSLGPSEIVSGVPRGMSMGPSEIIGSMKLKQLGKQEIITPCHSRRKSCFLKLQEIDEGKVVEKEKVKGSSPKSRKVVPAKLMDPKQSAIAKNTEEKKMTEENLSTNGKTRIQRRGVSLGPSEIVSGARRGMSMGPSEISGSMKPKQLGKQEMITPCHSRRKSCFLKLQEIDEEKVVEKVRVKGSSPSPKSRKVAFKNQVRPTQAITTTASKKGIKKEDGIISSIQPKKLFKEGENLVNKNPIKPGRVVASRYNQNTSQASVVRKRSLPENDKYDTERCEKKRSSSAGKSRVDADEIKNLGTETQVKKKQWEIPNEVVVHISLEDEEKSPESMGVLSNLLPRIRIAHCMNESPRDSGPAKRVAELTGKNSYFSNTDVEMEPSICQVLNFAAEDQEI